MKNPKKLTVSTAKAKAWHEFSIFIRRRDSTTFGTQCYTCGKYYPIEKMQAGHFIQGRHATHLFDERFCHAQCSLCNIFNHGALFDYEEHLIKDYGKEVVEEAKAHRKDIKQFKVYELEEIYQKYKALNKTEELTEQFWHDAI